MAHADLNFFCEKFVHNVCAVFKPLRAAVGVVRDIASPLKVAFCVHRLTPMQLSSYATLSLPRLVLQVDILYFSSR